MKSSTFSLSAINLRDLSGQDTREVPYIDGMLSINVQCPYCGKKSILWLLIEQKRDSQKGNKTK